MFKYYLILLLRLLLRILWIVPLKENSIILTSFAGRRYSCNPKYFAEYMLTKSGYEVYFALKKDSDVKVKNGIKRVDFGSLKHIYLLMSCKYILVNSSDYTKYFPYRRGQAYVYTHHGHSVYKVGDMSYLQSTAGRKILNICAKEEDYYLVTSLLEADYVEKRSALDRNKIIAIGYPRNDIFFKHNETLIKSIKKRLSLDDEVGLILYAPTYRGSDKKQTDINGYGFEILDVARVIQAFNKKFNKKHVMLFRAHHDTMPTNLSDECINVSDYPDMQELILVADYLITDYSSTMWDFALQKRPGFLYTPDLEQYSYNIPKSHPIDQWVYPYAVNNEDLIKLINSYENETSEKRIESYFDRTGCQDKGTACNQLFNILVSGKEK